MAKKLAGLFIVGMLLSGPIPSVGFANSSIKVVPYQSKDQYYHDFINDSVSEPGVAQVKLSATLEAVTAALKVTKSQQEQEGQEQEKSTSHSVDKIIEQKVRLTGLSHR